MKKFFLTLSTVLLLNICITTAFADELSGIHPLLSDRFVIGAGGMQANLDGTASLNSSGIIDGGNIDLQDDLGFDDTESIWAAKFKWRITDKFNLSLEYLEIDQSNTYAISENIKWGDLVFQTGTAVDAKFNLGFTQLFLGYSLIKTEQAELGIGGGLHFLDIEAKLGGAAIVNGISTTYAAESADFLAPLPNFGVYGGYAFSPKWYVGATVDWLDLSIDDYSGSLTGVGVNIQYQAFEHAGFGVGYKYFNVNVRVKASDWNGKVDYTYHGPTVFMTVNF